MAARVGIIMGSQSDWETMKNAAQVLEQLGVEHEVRIMSAHRTPDAVDEWAGGARARGIQVIIAGAGGAAHLAGVAASKTSLPILGVPMLTSSLGGLDSLLSIVQMPAGIPVGTTAIGKAGAINAGILAAQICATADPKIAEAIDNYRKEMTEKVLANPTPVD
jgi:5-(carboxyamino)imidazole ribonucleotide mutase